MSAGAFARLCDLGAKTFYDQMVESADLEQIEHVHFRKADADYGKRVADGHCETIGAVNDDGGKVYLTTWTCSTKVRETKVSLTMIDLYYWPLDTPAPSLTEEERSMRPPFVASGIWH
jgi:hypothetical protein